MMKKIGFIGLGIMGKPMAKNLLKAGYSLIVYDINNTPVKELAEAGAKEGKSSKEVAAQCWMQRCRWCLMGTLNPDSALNCTSRL